jgi:hypothetical protein
MSPVRRTILEGNTPSESDDTLGNASAKRFEFSADGLVQVKVKVKHGKKAQAKAIPADDPPSGNGFTLTRLVMNLEVPGGAEKIELHVRVKDSSETKLAYWYNNQWNIPGQSKSGDFLITTISDWPADPQVGIGH